MKRTLRTLCVLSLLLIGGLAFARLRRPPAWHPGVLVDSTRLTRTTITAHPDSPIPPGSNLVYCASFQLAWNECRDAIRADIRLEGQPPTADLLNRASVHKEDVPEESCVAGAGLVGKGIVDRLNRELQARFGAGAPRIPERSDPDALLAYAFLQRRLPFRHAFECLDEPVRFRAASGPVPVRAFGLSSYTEGNTLDERRARQVEILAYDCKRRDCIVRLITTTNDEMVLARVPPRATLTQTVRWIEEQTRARPAAKGTWVGDVYSGPLDGDYDTLRIPLLDLRVQHAYRDLERKVVLNQGPFNGYRLLEARQYIAFRLDENGAELRSSGDTYANIGMDLVHGPKELVFDKPFLIWLRRKGGRFPYLAMWVADAELMVRM